MDIYFGFYILSRRNIESALSTAYMGRNSQQTKVLIVRREFLSWTTTITRGIVRQAPRKWEVEAQRAGRGREKQVRAAKMMGCEAQERDHKAPRMRGWLHCRAKAKPRDQVSLGQESNPSETTIRGHRPVAQLPSGSRYSAPRLLAFSLMQHVNIQVDFQASTMQR